MRRDFSSLGASRKKTPLDDLRERERDKRIPPLWSLCCGRFRVYTLPPLKRTHTRQKRASERLFKKAVGKRSPVATKKDTKGKELLLLGWPSVWECVSINAAKLECRVEWNEKERERERKEEEEEERKNKMLAPHDMHSRFHRDDDDDDSLYFKGAYINLGEG